MTRSAQDVKLWPLEILSAEYITNTTSCVVLDPKRLKGAKAGIRLRLRATAGTTFDKLALDTLTLFIRGSDDLPMRVYEQILANSMGVLVRPVKDQNPWYEFLDEKHIKHKGFEDSEALLPYGPQSFHGYRLLHEYFSFPQRFMFVDISGLNRVFKRCEDKDIELVILFNQVDRSLEEIVSEQNFYLHCAPAINLFPKRADRIHLNNRDWEFHILPKILCLILPVPPVSPLLH